MRLILKVIKLFDYLADQFPSMWSEWLRTMMKSILDPRHVATTFKVCMTIKIHIDKFFENYVKERRSGHA